AEIAGFRPHARCRQAAPPPSPKGAERSSRFVKIASWNVNSLNVRLPHLEQWLRGFGPDIVGIQETKLEDHKFPDATLAALGYRSVCCGQRTYSGVASLARDAPTDVLAGVPGLEHEHKRAISATCGDLRVVNRYALNGQGVAADKYELE